MSEVETIQREKSDIWTRNYREIDPYIIFMKEKSVEKKHILCLILIKGILFTYARIYPLMYKVMQFCVDVSIRRGIITIYRVKTRLTQHPLIILCMIFCRVGNNLRYLKMLISVLFIYRTFK